METMISILILIALLMFIQIALYIRTVHLRRVKLMPKVSEYLARSDVSDIQRKIATEAFIDALSVELPLSLLRSHLMTQEVIRVKKGHKHDILQHCLEETPANKELANIIYMMFRLNRKFNGIIMLYCFVRKFQFAHRGVRMNRKEVEMKVGTDYVDLKHQHS